MTQNQVLAAGKQTFTTIRAAYDSALESKLEKFAVVNTTGLSVCYFVITETEWQNNFASQVVYKNFISK